MAKITVVPVDRPEIAARTISTRLRSQLNYFMSPPGSPGVPALGENEVWFSSQDVARWIDEGVIFLVSPLDTANQTEVELSEEQEDFLLWLQDHGVQHVRIDN
ncbi:MAG: hypothetical protein U0794_12305 [Isosphaeraceae bacterium]